MKKEEKHLLVSKIVALCIVIPFIFILAKLLGVKMEISEDIKVAFLDIINALKIKNDTNYTFITSIIAVPLGISVGLNLAVLLTPIVCLLRTIFYVPFIRKKLLEDAKKNGHIIKATLKKHHTIRNHSIE